eukprot:CAMPEP_0204606624 /NCGR_PEP_ID=MMETSP0661-20131031/59197_1 /ASSEMBLY_ACC=CAM_ASM_000606 /TAXON_ID=109239 /ORGANISM="Alexandrium margalefi, Strain AMGDE01CS-322" /LENGTH=247 /DNA_ID=CAMNT_0051617965 /DNA_START=62 /DNA_END=806 /DNA_ORIENTATION=+
MAPRALAVLRRPDGTQVYFNDRELAIKFLTDLCVCSASLATMPDIDSRCAKVSASLAAHRLLDEKNEKDHHCLGLALQAARPHLSCDTWRVLRRLQRDANDAKHSWDSESVPGLDLYHGGWEALPGNGAATVRSSSEGEALSGDDVAPVQSARDAAPGPEFYDISDKDCSDPQPVHNCSDPTPCKKPVQDAAMKGEYEEAASLQAPALLPAARQLAARVDDIAVGAETAFERLEAQSGRLMRRGGLA